MKEDSQIIEVFRETYRKAEKAASLENILSNLHAALAEITDRLGRHIGVSEAPAPAVQRRRRKKGTRKSRARLTPEEKKEQVQSRKLRGDVHKLVIRVGRLRNVSPATVYQDLRQWGASNREATLDQLEKRKAFLTKALAKK